MIDLASEYLAIVDFYLREKEYVVLTSKVIGVEREQLIEYLQRYGYEKAETKLDYWKKLYWIQCDEGLHSKRIYNQDTGKYQRLVAIDLDMVEVLRPIVPD